MIRAGEPNFFIYQALNDHEPLALDLTTIDYSLPLLGFINDIPSII